MKLDRSSEAYKRGYEYGRANCRENADIVRIPHDIAQGSYNHVDYLVGYIEGQDAGNVAAMLGIKPSVVKTQPEKGSKMKFKFKENDDSVVELNPEKGSVVLSSGCKMKYVFDCNVEDNLDSVHLDFGEFVLTKEAIADLIEFLQVAEKQLSEV